MSSSSDQFPGMLAAFAIVYSLQTAPHNEITLQRLNQIKLDLN
jgi:hypothetical protein